jgi:nitronate monooxygenase
MNLPTIIQGGMGVGVSDWRLANAVARAGQLGVVSGTGVSSVLVRRLQDGDPDGAMRRALAHFPVAAVAERILEAYFIPGGKPAEQSYRVVPMYTERPAAELQLLTVAANFAEVWLAREGHQGVVGINLMEKIQLPNPASLYGAMLAGVDYVLMGAGIPREIPGILDRLAGHQAVELSLHVEQAGPDDAYALRFDPRALLPELGDAPLARPRFLAIIASTTLAIALAKKATGRVDGFVIEGPTAGGHNAPPRGQLQLNERGEPIYGPRDEVDLEKIRALGLPFWLAGSYASPEHVQQALDVGAAGIQAGTIFALSAESGLSPTIRRTLLELITAGSGGILTDPLASPTGFPFKVADLPGSLSSPEVYAERPRQCDLGYLRTAYKREDGQLGFRCPAEPVATYVAKGGAEADTVGRKCLCNALFANIGMGQQRRGYAEQALVTLGDDTAGAAHLAALHADGYSAQDAVAYLLERVAVSQVS